MGLSAVAAPTICWYSYGKDWYADDHSRQESYIVWFG